MKFLIWSNEHGMWWRKNRVGYTPDKAEAGTYGYAEAVRICKDANAHQGSDEKPNETMVPAGGRKI